MPLDDDNVGWGGSDAVFPADIIDIFNPDNPIHLSASPYEYGSSSDPLFFRSNGGKRISYTAQDVNELLTQDDDEGIKRRIIAMIPNLPNEQLERLRSGLRGNGLQAVRDLDKDGDAIALLEGERATISFASFTPRPPRPARAATSAEDAASIANMVGDVPAQMAEAALDPDARAHKLRSRFRIAPTDDDDDKGQKI